MSIRRSIQDELRHAFRTLARNRRSTGTVIAALGLGAGAVLSVLGISMIESFRPFVLRGALLLDPVRSGGEWVRDVVAPAVVQEEGLRQLQLILLVLAGLTFGIAVLHALIAGAARRISRLHGLAVRSALGASPARLNLHQAVEAVLLGSMGLSLGIGMGLVGSAGLSRSWPHGLREMPTSARVVVAGLLIGLAVIAISIIAHRSGGGRTSRADLLRAGARSTPGRGLTESMNLLVIAQVALTALLLLGGGLLLHAAYSTHRHIGAGGHVENTMLMELDLPAHAAPNTEARASFYAELIRYLDEMPGTDAETLSTPGTHVGIGGIGMVTAQCMCARGGIYVPLLPGPVRHHAVGPGFFASSGIGVTAGREFTDGDRIQGPAVAVVSRSMASEYFAGGAAIGRRVRIGGFDGRWHTVVGIVPDIPATGPGGARLGTAAVYVPILQAPPLAVDVTFRTAPGADPDAVARALGGGVAAQVEGVEPGSPVSITAYIDRHQAPLRWLGRVLMAVSALLLVLALLSVGSVMRLNILHRHREIAVRKALGASPAAILRTLLRQALVLTVIGASLGVGAAPGLAAALQQLEPGVPLFQPAVHGGTGLLLGAAVLFGCLAPAWKAARARTLQLLNQP